MRTDYKAIFFDWDGTAVENRSADATRVLAAMEKLLLAGRKLIIISGTTYPNICKGKLESLLSPKALQNLYLGLGRGVYDYGYDKNGKLEVIANRTPKTQELIKLHSIVFDLHCLLLEKHGLPTDICFSRPNYCKLDLTVDQSRDTALFLQEGEVERTAELLKAHGFEGGITALCEKARQMGAAVGLEIDVTTDAKFVEIGFSTKSTNVDAFMQRLAKENIMPCDCSFWGDEFGEIGADVWGSDSLMITKSSSNADFYSVSALKLPLPKPVVDIGGGYTSFIKYLEECV